MLQIAVRYATIVIEIAFHVSNYVIRVLQLSDFRGRVCTLSGTICVFCKQIQRFGFAAILFSWKGVQFEWYMCVLCKQKSMFRFCSYLVFVEGCAF